jgi:hypothetical protein
MLFWVRLAKKQIFNREEHEGHEGKGFLSTFVNFVFFVVKCVAIRRDKACSLDDFSTKSEKPTSHGGDFF